MYFTHPEIGLVSVALILILAILASKTSGRLGMPSLILFMLLGLALGGHGLGIIQLTDSPWERLKLTCEIALALILFSGGLDTQFSQVKPIMWRGASLATFGVFITAMVTAIAAYFVLNVTFAQAFLLGSIISSTDAAAVFSVLRSKGVGLKHRLKPTLEFESGSNDPMAMALTVTAISLVLGEASNGFIIGGKLVLNLALGVGIGLGIGRVTQLIINHMSLPYDGLFSVLVLAIALLTYGGTEYVQGNGLLAVYCAGITLAHHPFIHKQTILKFFDGIAWVMQIMIFVSLGLVINPQAMWEHAHEAFIIALVLMGPARLLAVYLGLIPFKGVTHREKLFISWVGLKGAAPLVFALFPFMYIAQGFSEGMAILFLNIIMFMVLLSVLVQGTTLTKMARGLHLDLPTHKRTNYPLELEQRTNFQSQMQEIFVPAECDAVEKTLVELNLPTDSLIVLISRGNEFIMPNGSTKIKALDKLLVLATTHNDLEGVYASLGLAIPETT